MNRRVLKEIATLTQNEIEGAYFEFWDENDIYNFHGFVVGPPDTPYEGGQFWFHIELPKEYPFKPPKFMFKTKIFLGIANKKYNIFLILELTIFIILECVFAHQKFYY